MGDDTRIDAAEEQAFVGSMGALVQDLLLLRNGEASESAVRARFEEVLDALHALPVRGWVGSSGIRLVVYRGEDDDGEGGPSGTVA